MWKIKKQGGIKNDEKKKIKLGVLTLLSVLSVSSAVFAGSYGGYSLPVHQGNTYWGEAHKSRGANSCVYNQVDLLTNTSRATFWITQSNKNQYSNDYYFQVGDKKNMYSYGAISSGYVGMENYYNSSTEAYVDGWINFN
ncbi:hypothetical protein SAMN04487886_108618 [Clostridium sp. DSM 8431]|nr:hypothetical protein SAMN04487886_108618 [Clostridium sp. DSM 8431]